MDKWTIGAALALSVGMAQAAIKEDPVSYQDGGTTMKGFVVYDDQSKAKRPGVVVIHEWWGITKHTRDEARKLAAHGYTAFVADMYGDGKTADNPKDAGALSGAVRKDPAVMQSRFNAARDDAREACDGRRQADRRHRLLLRRLGRARHGARRQRSGGRRRRSTPAWARAGPPAAPGKVKAKVLVLNGADDPFIKPEQVAAFKQEMDAAKVDYRYVDYPGAVHAFTNPEATEKGKQFNLPLAYNAEADKQSKAEMAKFLAATLKK